MDVEDVSDSKKVVVVSGGLEDELEQLLGAPTILVAPVAPQYLHGQNHNDAVAEAKQPLVSIKAEPKAHTPTSANGTHTPTSTGAVTPTTSNANGAVVAAEGKVSVQPQSQQPEKKKPKIRVKIAEN